MACRSGELCVLKRGWQSAKIICPLDSQPVGLVRREKNVIVATMDNTFMSINSKVQLFLNFWFKNLNINVFFPNYELNIAK